MSSPKTDETKGRAKRAAAEVTDDNELRGEGTVDKVAAKVKDTVDTAADKAKEMMRRRDEGKSSEDQSR